MSNVEQGGMRDDISVEDKQDDIIDELQDLGTQSSFDHGRKSGIGASAVQITTASTVAEHGVLVKAANGNAIGSHIYVGNSDVTADTTDATDGYELGVGEGVVVPVDNANKVYVIGSEADLKVFWITV